jgi:hypothetical protein
MVWYFPLAALFFVVMAVLNLRQFKHWRASRDAMNVAREHYVRLTQDYEGYCETVRTAIVTQEDVANRYRRLAEECRSTLATAERMIAEASQIVGADPKEGAKP